MFISCTVISNIIYCKFNIINIDIHVQLISVICKHHFMGMYFSQQTYNLITPFSNIDFQFSLQSVRLVN